MTKNWKNFIRITAFWSNSNSEQQSKSSLEGSVWIQNGIQKQESGQNVNKLTKKIEKILSELQRFDQILTQNNNQNLV